MDVDEELAHAVSSIVGGSENDEAEIRRLLFDLMKRDKVSAKAVRLLLAKLVERFEDVSTQAPPDTTALDQYFAAALAGCSGMMVGMRPSDPKEVVERAKMITDIALRKRLELIDG